MAVRALRTAIPDGGSRAFSLRSVSGVSIEYNSVSIIRATPTAWMDAPLPHWEAPMGLAVGDRGQKQAPEWASDWSRYVGSR
ncbi:hypothetical protein GGI01_003462, partial [Coemansia sp. RSA 376]